LFPWQKLNPAVTAKKRKMKRMTVRPKYHEKKRTKGRATAK